MRRRNMSGGGVDPDADTGDDMPTPSPIKIKRSISFSFNTDDKGPESPSSPAERILPSLSDRRKKQSFSLLPDSVLQSPSSASVLGMFHMPEEAASLVSSNMRMRSKHAQMN